MKISINDVRVNPKTSTFGLCVFGEPANHIKEWVEYWGLHTAASEKFTNINLPDNFNMYDAFLDGKVYDYLDGFSPNLNKHLHLGHLSNLVLAKTIQSLGISNKSIAILGDTLTGEVNKEQALESYNNYCKVFNYRVDHMFMASEMTYHGSDLCDGTDQYIGTKIFDLGDEKLVGIKSGGATSYFYQDVALASKLNAPTLYLTGSEQSNHFKALKKLFPYIEHVGLGLVTMDGKKQSSRNGNVIYASEVIDIMNNEFNNLQLSYNVIAGQILKSNPSSTKDINSKIINNVKMSMGLYLSYTAARLKSAGVNYNMNNTFHSPELNFVYLKSKVNILPNILFQSLVEHCNKINNLYATNKIQGSPENNKMFSLLLDDLELGMKKLGLFSIEKV